MIAFLLIAGLWCFIGFVSWVVAYLVYRVCDKIDLHEWADQETCCYATILGLVTTILVAIAIITSTSGSTFEYLTSRLDKLAAVIKSQLKESKK